MSAHPFKFGDVVYRRMVITQTTVSFFLVKHVTARYVCLEAIEGEIRESSPGSMEGTACPKKNEKGQFVVSDHSKPLKKKPVQNAQGDWIMRMPYGAIFRYKEPVYTSWHG